MSSRHDLPENELMTNGTHYVLIPWDADELKAQGASCPPPSQDDDIQALIQSALREQEATVERREQELRAAGLL